MPSIWEGWLDMAKARNYSRKTSERAVRLVREHAGDYPSEFAAMKAVAARLGIGCAESLRKWVRQVEIDQGEAPGVTTAEAGSRGSVAWFRVWVFGGWRGRWGCYWAGRGWVVVRC
jgi:hypothetical protein